MWGSRERQPDLSTLKITSFYTVHSVPMIETDRPRWKRIPQIVQASTGLCPVPSAILLSSIKWCRKSHTLQSFRGRAKVGPSSQCFGECKGLVVFATDR